MTSINRRTELGPSIVHNTREAQQMARIATEDTFVTDGDGIRRLVAKGSPIPGYMGLEHEGEQVETRSLASVVVDEEAAKSQAERQGYDERKPDDGLRNTAAEVAASGRKSGRGKQGSEG